MKRGKRILALALAGVMMLGMPAVPCFEGIGTVIAQAADVTVVDQGKCGDNISYVLYSDGKMKLTGTGKMKNSGFATNTTIDRELVKEITIGNGITNIGNYMFYGFWNLTKVTVPDTVTEIGEYAFKMCSELTTINLPSGLKTLGEHAFYCCYSLDNVTLPEGLEELGDGAFWGCYALQEIKIPVSVGTIGTGTFAECTSLKSVEIPEGITAISMQAFEYCPSLTEVTIPSTVERILGGAFAYCTSLKTIRFLGNAPTFSEFEWSINGKYVGQEGKFISDVTLKAFNNVTANVYYPAGNSTYTSANMLDYGGTLTWIAEGTASSGSGTGCTNSSNTDSTVAAQAMYRLYNPNSGEHFYTASTTERDNLVSVGWNYEGVAWNAPVSGTAVYRLYNPNAGDHHYTMSAEERDNLVNIGWSYEGIGWYSASDSGQVLYRLYNPNAVAAGAHHYTGSTTERDNLVSLGWNYEGIGWYGVK